MTLLERAQRRSRLVTAIRGFFSARGVKEVSTPILIPYATTEPSLENLCANGGSKSRFLRTSPESALKTLLAAGLGDIYEIAPVFRADEYGALHREEFTLVEWYRVGFDHHQLMSEVEELLAICGWDAPVQRVSYASLFGNRTGLDPHTADRGSLEKILMSRTTAHFGSGTDRAMLMDLLYLELLEPELRQLGTVLLYDFPECQRAYARLSSNSPQVAQRFELIIGGLEIANGYFEVVDAEEQLSLFARENGVRRQRGLPQIEPDQQWLRALEHGMPECAGVALGLERLMMVLSGSKNISSVLLVSQD